MEMKDAAIANAKRRNGIKGTDMGGKLRAELIKRLACKNIRFAQRIETLRKCRIDDIDTSVARTREVKIGGARLPRPLKEFSEKAFVKGFETVNCGYGGLLEDQRRPAIKTISNEGLNIVYTTQAKSILESVAIGIKIGVDGHKAMLCQLLLDDNCGLYD